MHTFEPYKKTLLSIGPIISRHVFLFVNFIIFSVVVLLYYFGNTESAIFIGVIIIFNIFLGIIQDTRARISLEKLQLLTALRVIRLNNDGSEENILAEHVEKNDHLKLKIGDQIPCDGKVLSSNGLEVSEALVTGESDSFPRGIGELVNAGDVVTTGTGVIEVKTSFRDGRIARLNEESRNYSASPSPIQSAINKVIKYTGYILFVVILYVVGRGFVIHESAVKIVLDIGALASIIIPQGLVVITTLLFAFGASSYSKKHVLFQEINATEKLGRIKNLCMDKTGTLTENFLVVEKMHIFGEISTEEARALVAVYMRGSGDSSQTMNAVKKFIGTDGVGFDVIHSLPFSSWRQYGAVEVDGRYSENSEKKRETVFVGSPDIFLPHMFDEKEREWLENIIMEELHSGKRILCVARSYNSSLQEKGSLSRNLSNVKLSVVTAFIFQSGFREGVNDAIDFFQKRGVKIRIISGDNVDTVRTIAAATGVNNTDAAITGYEMQKWSSSDYDEKVSSYTIFARVVPEQKVKIIQALKKDGFTAMVGDGANDILAIKTADLGIAMFDGVQATRSLAGIILMKNSFADLPGGVKLADNFIRNIEIYAGIFINQSLLGLLFFLIISIFGYSFPLTPLNITFINYFAIGIPGMLIGYWAIKPSGKIFPASSESFLSLILPFVVWSSIIEAISVAVVFLLSPEYLKTAASNTLVIIGFIVCGLFFFVLAPRVYRGTHLNSEKLNMLWLVLLEFFVFYFGLKIPLVIRFFTITTPLPSLIVVGQALLVLVIFGIGHYFVREKFFSKNFSNTLKV